MVEKMNTREWECGARESGRNRQNERARWREGESYVSEKYHEREREKKRNRAKVLEKDMLRKVLAMELAIMWNNHCKYQMVKSESDSLTVQPSLWASICACAWMVVCVCEWLCACVNSCVRVRNSFSLSGMTINVEVQFYILITRKCFLENIKNNLWHFPFWMNTC